MMCLEVEEGSSNNHHWRFRSGPILGTGKLQRSMTDSGICAPTLDMPLFGQDEQLLRKLGCELIVHALEGLRELQQFRTEDSHCPARAVICSGQQAGKPLPNVPAGKLQGEEVQLVPQSIRGRKIVEFGPA